MPRPPETEKRAELARRAVVVLQREGLELPAARLADSLGIKRPTLLYHFPNYGALIELALIELLTEQVGFVHARVETHAHPIDQLIAYIAAVHEFHRGREDRVVFLTQAVAATAGERTQRILVVTEQAYAAQRQVYAERIRAAIAAGTVVPCDPEALVALARAWSDGLLIQRVISRASLATAYALAAEILSRFKRSPAAPPTKRPNKQPRPGLSRARKR